MVVSVAILIGACILALYEVPILWKKQMHKECFLFLFLLTAGTILSIASALNKPIPNPLDLIQFIFQPVSDWLDKTLGG